MSVRLDKTLVGKTYDRRCKLSDEQRVEMYSLKGLVSQRKLAAQFGVSRRLVQFILFPEKLEENLKRRAERGGSSLYYTREYHREHIKGHRKYKRQLVNDGKIELQLDGVDKGC